MRVFIEFMPCLGDFVTELPILHALHERVRPLDIEVSVDRFGAALLEDYDWVGRRHVRDDGLWGRLGPVASSYREPYDLLLYLRSNPKIKMTRLLVRARRKLGAEAFDESVSQQGAVRHRFSILEQVLGGDLPEISTRITLAPQRTAEARAALGLADGARVACLGPGAGEQWRRWPAQRFVELARALRDRFDVVVALGSQAEADLCGELATEAGTASLIGHPLPTVAALLATTALYVGNDSGLSHLAAAQGCTAISIGAPSNAYYRPRNGYCVPGRVADLSARDVLAFLEENVLTALDRDGSTTSTRAAALAPGS